MKRNIKLVTGLLLLLLACSKDFDGIVIDTFDFNFSVQHSNNGFVYEGTSADLRVVPERIIQTSKYTFKYNISDGQGFFQMPNGEILEQQTDLELNELLWDMVYIPTTVGSHAIKMQVQDQRGNEKEYEMVYEATHAPFSVVFSAGANTFLVNSDNKLLLTISSQGDYSEYETLSVDGSLEDTYSLVFTVDGGTGNFVIGENTYEPGQRIEIDSGNFDFNYIPETLGNHQITLVATAPDGAERTEIIDIEVENVSFFILATSPSNRVDIGQPIDVTLSVQSSDLSGEIDYDLAFFFASESEGVGELLDENQNAVNPGTPRDIEPGEYKYSFSSSVLGKKKMYFDVTDSNNQSKRDSLEIEVSSLPFTFNGQALGTSVGINQPMELSLSLSTTADPNSNVEYNITFEQSEGNGVLRDLDNQVIPPNTAYDVEPGVFKLLYTPTSLGQHDLIFNATDNFGQSIEVDISFTSTNAQLSFLASSSRTEMFVGQQNSISVTLAEQGNYNLTYQMSYFVAGGAGTLSDGDGNPINASTFFDITPGTITYSFEPDLPGNYTLTFTLRDSNGQTIPATTEFLVSNTDFQFTANEVNDQVPLGSNNPINFNIIPGSSTSGATYTMTYDSSNNGSLNINGTVYGPGEPISVQQGSFQGVYTPTLDGSYQIDFVVEDSNGVVKNDDVRFTVSSRDFTLDAIPSNTTANVGDAVPVNLTINESGGTGGTYTILVASNSNGSILYNGTAYALGEPFVVNSGASTFSYIGDNAGSHRLDITATASYGVEQNDNATINFSGNQFTLTAEPNSPSASIDDGVGINFSINETLPGTDTYTAIFSTTGSGTLNYNGNTINPGQSFTITAGNSNGTYTGTSSGNHSIDFTVTSSSGATADDDVSIFYDSIDFSFGATGTKPSEIVNTDLPINFSFSQTSGTLLTYTMQYTSTSSGDFLYNGTRYSPGQQIPILNSDLVSGGWSGSYRGFNTGQHDLEFTLTSSTNVSKSASVSIDVLSSNPVLNSLSFDDYYSAGQEDLPPPSGWDRRYRQFIRLDINNIDFDSAYPIESIVINNEIYNYNLDYIVGYLDVLRASNRTTCVIEINDNNITAKRQRSVTVQLVNNRGEYSNEILVTTPDFYLFKSQSACTINGCGPLDDSCRY